MATYGELKEDVAGWLNRRDILDRIPGWIKLVDTEIGQTLRVRCMVTSGVQSITTPYVSLPPDFATMESIRDNTTGELLELRDEWSGHWSAGEFNAAAPVTAYRLVHDCIEWLPHPPQPLPDTWQPQQVLMGWYAKPQPLVLDTDTNTVLEALYAVYLFGLLKQGAMYERDDDDVAKWDAAWQQAVTRANTSKQQSDYSGAPFRSELATVF